MSEQLKCVICSQTIGVDVYGWGGGHNAQPVSDGRCCEPCNAEVVMPTRLKQHGFSQAQIDAFPDEFFREGGWRNDG